MTRTRRPRYQGEQSFDEGFDCRGETGFFGYRPVIVTCAGSEWRVGDGRCRMIGRRRVPLRVRRVLSGRLGVDG